MLTIPLAGDIVPGRPINRNIDDEACIPQDFIEDGEELYRLIGRGPGALNFRRDDLLVVEPRPDGRASTGEIVLVEHDGLTYVGRWWTKRRRRALLGGDDIQNPILEKPGMRVLGAVTAALRPEVLWPALVLPETDR